MLLFTLYLPKFIQFHCFLRVVFQKKLHSQWKSVSSMCFTSRTSAASMSFSASLSPSEDSSSFLISVLVVHSSFASVLRVRLWFFVRNWVHQKTRLVLTCFFIIFICSNVAVKLCSHDPIEFLSIFSLGLLFICDARLEWTIKTIPFLGWCERKLTTNVMKKSIFAAPITPAVGRHSQPIMAWSSVDFTADISLKLSAIQEWTAGISVESAEAAFPQKTRRFWWRYLVTTSQALLWHSCLHFESGCCRVLQCKAHEKNELQ